MDQTTSISIQKALEQSVIDTNRVLQRWKRTNPHNFNDYDSIRSLLIGWLFRHLRRAVNYKHLKMYGRPIINIDYQDAKVTSIVFPSAGSETSLYGSEAKFINTICEKIDYEELSKKVEIYNPSLDSEFTTNDSGLTRFPSVNNILDKIRNTKFE